MKHLWILAAAFAAAVACSPQVYPVYLDVRQPSPSGLSLAGKNISVVYMDGTAPADSLFDRKVSSALARSLEADYFGGEELVGIFRIPQADTVSLELMHSLVMDTEGDVVFLLSSHLGEPGLETNQPAAGATSVDSAFVCPVLVPLQTRLKVYDSMGEDKIHNYSGHTTLRPLVYNSGLVPEESLKALAFTHLDKEADVMGRRISSRFLSEWETESFSFYYFDDSHAANWFKGIQKVSEGDFPGAVEAWSPLVKEGIAVTRACACYDMAMVFYLAGNYSLSARWLEVADRLENLSLSPGLHKRLAVHLEK